MYRKIAEGVIHQELVVETSALPGPSGASWRGLLATAACLNEKREDNV